MRQHACSQSPTAKRNHLLQRQLQACYMSARSASHSDRKL